MVISGSTLLPFLATSTLLLAFFALAMRVRWRRHHSPIRFLIRLGPQSRWQTRPTLMETEEDVALAREVAALLEGAGLGRVEVCTFLHKPTMDLLLQPERTELSSSEIAQLLVGRKVIVETLHGGVKPTRYV